MDPDQTLRNLRDAVSAWHDAGDRIGQAMDLGADDLGARQDQERAGDAMAQAADAMDAWLCRGGFSPVAWSGAEV